MFYSASRRAHDQYAHGIALSYLHHGVSYDETLASIPPHSQIAQLGPLEICQATVGGIRHRLSAISPGLADQIFEPSITTLKVDGADIFIPIINEQGKLWYGSAGATNYDFTIERELGLLDGADTIYDLGGHHGVWAAYYGKNVSGVRNVFSFEPSILNVEISTLLMLINGINNVTTQGMAVGVNVTAESDSRAGMLVDYINGQFLVTDFKRVSQQRADFIKIDIEGYEYELVTEYPWIFNMARNLHLELHIPHLEGRQLSYRRVLEKIPFKQFDVLNYQNLELTEIDEGSELSGFCSLMLKRKE